MTVSDTPPGGGSKIHSGLVSHPEPESETAPVSITVSALVPVSGRGEVRYVASVTLDISGVELMLHGWMLRLNKRGQMHAFLPAYHGSRTGEWAACLSSFGHRAHIVGRPPFAS